MALALAAGFGKWGRFRITSRPARVLLEMEGTSWPGFTNLQVQGFMLLVGDALEAGARMPVLQGAELVVAPPAEVAILRVKASRTEINLEAELSWVQAERTESSTRATEGPRAVFKALLAPFAPRGAWLAAFIPADLDPFMDLLEASGADLDRDIPRRVEAARRLAEHLPDCASAWLALARLEYRCLMLTSMADPPSQEICQGHFERALAAFPNYPRAVNQYATFLTDMGNQRLALTQLESALRYFPDSIQLLSALAYAARTSGLLEVAARSTEKRLRLQGGLWAGRGVAENVFLYRGELDRFEQSLGSHRPGRQEAILDFYRGYCLLLKGDNPAALAKFRQSAAAGGSRQLFEALSEVFALGLEGRKEQALERLNIIRNQRLRLRVPDGEFTFKLAEAYAVLGRVEESLDVAERAFSQGFGCTPWYEKSPLLAPIRSLPRWPALRQHLQERQHLLESRFSLSRFR